MPLLFESKYFLKFIKYKVVVYCDEQEQLRRLLLRNPQLTPDDARARINAQMNLKEKLKMADMCIDNSTSLENTQHQIYNMHEIFKATAKKRQKWMLVGLVFTLGLTSIIAFKYLIIQNVFK